MAFAFFLIPIQDEGGSAAQEMNQFVTNHRVVNVECRLLEQGANVGSAKVEKYGDSILEQVNSFWGGGSATSG